MLPWNSREVGSHSCVYYYVPSTTCLAVQAVSSFERFAGGGCKMNSTDLRGDGIVAALARYCPGCCCCCGGGCGWCWHGESLLVVDPPPPLSVVVSTNFAVAKGGGGFKPDWNVTPLVMVRLSNDMELLIDCVVLSSVWHGFSVVEQQRRPMLALSFYATSRLLLSRSS